MAEVQTFFLLSISVSPCLRVDPCPSRPLSRVSLFRAFAVSISQPRAGDYRRACFTSVPVSISMVKPLASLKS